MEQESNKEIKKSNSRDDTVCIIRCTRTKLTYAEPPTVVLEVVVKKLPDGTEKIDYVVNDPSDLMKDSNHTILLPFVAELLSQFPTQSWTVKNPQKKCLSSYIADLTKTLEENNDTFTAEEEPLGDLFSACASSGGIDPCNLPDDWSSDQLADAHLYLNKYGLMDFDLSLQKGSLTLLATLAKIFVCCQTLDPSSFPLQLENPQRLNEQTKSITDRIDNLSERCKLSLYLALLTVASLNQDCARVLFRFHLTSTWEELLLKLLERFPFAPVLLLPS